MQGDFEEEVERLNKIYGEGEDLIRIIEMDVRGTSENTRENAVRCLEAAIADPEFEISDEDVTLALMADTPVIGERDETDTLFGGAYEVDDREILMDPGEVVSTIRGEGARTMNNRRGPHDEVMFGFYGRTKYLREIDEGNPILRPVTTNFIGANISNPDTLSEAESAIQKAKLEELANPDGEIKLFKPRTKINPDETDLPEEKSLPKLDEQTNIPPIDPERRPPLS